MKIYKHTNMQPSCELPLMFEKRRYSEKFDYSEFYPEKMKPGK